MPSPHCRTHRARVCTSIVRVVPHVLCVCVSHVLCVLCVMMCVCVNVYV